MKRSSENYVTIRRITRVFRHQNSININYASFFASEAFTNVRAFSTSAFVIEGVLNNLIERVCSTIKKNQENRYFDRQVKRAEQLCQSIEQSMKPSIGSKQDCICPDQEPQRVQNDKICHGESNLEKKDSNEKQKSHFSVHLSRHSCSKIDRPIVLSKDSKFTNSSKFIPLANTQSLNDLNTIRFQNVYRQKYRARQSIKERESGIPTLLTSKKNKNQKDFQYNFDYNGDKIPIANLVPQKASQINVLKTVCKIFKDRQDIRNPKKAQERIPFCNKLPSVHGTYQNMADSVGDFRELKSGIEKSFYQKGCKLSSIKVIQQDK